MCVCVLIYVRTYVCAYGLVTCIEIWGSRFYNAACVVTFIEYSSIEGKRPPIFTDVSRAPGLNNSGN